MASNFFSVLIDDELITLERNRVISIEPYENGTKILLEASHLEEEPFTYFCAESYDKVMQSYLSR
ncbi:hypothetical protein [Rubrolithibacter danxiaensis]|uniref:hypothetical protein n=1 Tax=Rubrolithibacter danxiaensis TaxID=3390805 RepID=UPI003BF8F354